jgi:hypothetical protein
MIVAGKIEALPTGFTRMIPTREVKRLLREGIIDSDPVEVSLVCRNHRQVPR